MSFEPGVVEAFYEVHDDEVTALPITVVSAGVILRGGCVRVPKVGLPRPNVYAGLGTFLWQPY